MKDAICGRCGPPVLSRREFFRRSGLGLGTLATALLLADERRLLAADGGRVDAARLRGPARSVIFLFMGGGPSHIDTWDPKPELARLQGKDVPESIARLLPKSNRLRVKNLHASPYSFQQNIMLPGI